MSWIDHSSCARHADRRLFRGFKGLKQAVKLEYKLGKYDKVTTAERSSTTTR